MTDTTIRKSIFVAANPETVWAHLTDAKLLGTWFHPAKADLVEGQEFTLVSAKDGDRMCYGSVQSATPHSHMKWAFSVGPLNGLMTDVDWHLTPVHGGTQLTLEHRGLPTSAEAVGLLLALDKGWHGFLGNLYDQAA
jgi:uncharacterized protein YndB with AHSA1/START domain